MSFRLALVTLKTVRDNVDDPAETLALIEALKAFDVEATIVPMNDVLAQPSSWDGLSVLTAYGYHHQPDGFIAALEQIQSHGLFLINSLPLIRWNVSKHYLRELEAKGRPLLPTLWLDAGTHDHRLEALMEAQQWDTAVAKPVISAGAHETRKISLKNAADHNEWLNRALATGCDYMLQGFAEEIVTEGEWSFIYFNGMFSHCVLKVAAKGDYRIQPEYGGTYTHQSPPNWLLEQADSILDSLPETPTYARIDGIVRDGKLLLMEVELIEPYLYALPDSRSINNAAAGLAKVVSGSLK